MSGLHLYLFGAPRLESDGKNLSIGRRKGLAILAYLALRGQPQSREALATLFWPDYDQSGALSNLRRELSRLRSGLGMDLVVADRRQAELATESDLWVDVKQYRRLLDRVAAHGCHFPAEPCPDCLAALQEAVGLQTERFLAGFNLPDCPEFDDWQFFEAEGLSQSLAEALQKLVQRHVQAGEHDEAIRYGRRWLALDPLHEPAHRELMIVFARAGQQAAALRQYKECVRILEEELGIEPEQETAQLYEAIRLRRFPLKGDNHILLEHEPAWAQFRAAVHDFLDTPGAAQPPQQRSGVALPSSEAETERAETEPPGAVEAVEQQPIQTLLEMSVSSLPSQATPFVGREREVSELRQMLWRQPPIRLVTLAGPGGIGKTRLATEVAAASAVRFRDGLLFVPLASLAAAEQIVPAIVQALDVQFREAGNEQEPLLRYLATRQQLVVLDNFEHLLDGIPLVEQIVARAPAVTILVTSREPLNLSSETVYRLSGLPYPQERAGGSREPADYGAVALLLQQIGRARPGFAPGPAEMQQVVRICQLVQGMPLALVLAASWIELLSLGEIGDEIAGSLDLLEGELRDLPARQRSIRAVFHGSWGMLDEEAQAAMARLAIFRGRFSRQAAQAVGRCSLRVLLALVNKSWLQRGDDGFQIHELVRQFAAERLRQLPGGEEDARDAHAAYYAGLLHEQDSLMKGQRQKEAFETVRSVIDQAAAAWRWLVERPGGLNVIVEQMLPALYRHVESLQRSGSLLPLLELALGASTRAGDALTLRAILLAAKTAFYRSGLPIRFEAMGTVVPFDDQLAEAWALAGQQPIPDFWRIVLCYSYGRNVARDEGLSCLRALVEKLRAEGAQWELAFCLHHVGQLIQLRPDDDANLTESYPYLVEALNILQEVGDGRERGYVLRSLGQHHRLREEFAEAIHYWEEARARLDAVGEWSISAFLHWHIGDTYVQMGDLDAAFAHYRTMSESALAHNDSSLVGDMLGKESYEAARYGRLEHSLETKWLALANARAAGDLFTEAWATWEMGELQRLRGEYEEALDWFERSLPLFTRYGDTTGIAFYHRGLAAVAADRGFHAAAAVNFEESLRKAQENGHAWSQAYALAGLARASMRMENLVQAKQQLACALDAARDTGDRAITLAALAVAAELLARFRQPFMALEVAIFVTSHPVAWTESRAQAEQVRESAELPAGKEAEAERHAQAHDVWSLVEEVRRLLAESPDPAHNALEAPSPQPGAGR